MKESIPIIFYYRPHRKMKKPSSLSEELLEKTLEFFYEIVKNGYHVIDLEFNVYIQPKVLPGNCYHREGIEEHVRVDIQTPDQRYACNFGYNKQEKPSYGLETLQGMIRECLIELGLQEKAK